MAKATRSSRPSAPIPSRSSVRRTLAREEGSSTILLLAVVLFLAAAGIGAMVLLSQAARTVERRSSLSSARRALEREARTVLPALANDPTPGADSRFDSVWSALSGLAKPGTHLTLTDLSDRLDLNLIRPELLTETSLKDTMTGGHSVDEFLQYRAEKGPFTSIDGYQGWFTPRSLEDDYTVYGYINVNTTFEDVLEKMFAARTGDAAAAQIFRTAIRGYLTRLALVGSGDLTTLFGLYEPELYPLFNIEPSMNVNFVPADVLRSILAYPYGTKPLPNGDAIADTILSERADREITQDDLSSLIQAKGEQQLVFQYLGTRTWFWGITASSLVGRVDLVVARIPGDQQVRFAILEDRFMTASKAVAARNAP